MKKIILIVLVIIGIVVIGLTIAKPKVQIPQTITRLKGTTYMETFNNTPGALLVDVRTPEEYAEGHIAGAINIDIEAPTFIDELKKLDPTTPTFVYCRSGNRSGQAVVLMKKLGFTKVTDLAGGILESPQLLTK